MSTAPGVLTAVRWNDLFPWLLLVRAARAALFVRVIALAVAGVWLTQWGWALVDELVGRDAPADTPLAWLTDRPTRVLGKSAASPAGAGPLDILAAPSAAVDQASASSSDAPALSLVLREMYRTDLFNAVDSHWYSGPLLRGWAWAVQPATRLIDAEGWQAAIAFILSGIWFLAVWGLFGGAIARIAGLYLTRGETIGPVAALRSAAAKWASSIAAPSFCFIVIAVFVLLLLFAGLCIRVGPLAFLAGATWAAALIAGAAIAIFAIGLIAGWPLMWSTIAVERTDAFDGVSRGYAFTYQRPLHWLFLVATATALGLLAQTAVSLLVDVTREATWWGASRGAGQQRALALLEGEPAPSAEEMGVLSSAGGTLIQFWTAALESFASAFPMAYLFAASVGIYLLLRRLVDSTELGEIAFDEGAPEPGLPPLVRDDATGTPTVQPDSLAETVTVTAKNDGEPA